MEGDFPRPSINMMLMKKTRKCHFGFFRGSPLGKRTHAATATLATAAAGTTTQRASSTPPSRGPACVKLFFGPTRGAKLTALSAESVAAAPWNIFTGFDCTYMRLPHDVAQGERGSVFQKGTKPDCVIRVSVSRWISPPVFLCCVNTKSIDTFSRMGQQQRRD